LYNGINFAFKRDTRKKDAVGEVSKYVTIDVE